MESFDNAAQKLPVYIVYGNAKEFTPPLAIPQNALEGSFEPHAGSTIARIQTCLSPIGLKGTIAQRQSLGMEAHVVHCGNKEITGSDISFPEGVVVHDWKALNESGRKNLLTKMGTFVDYSRVADRCKVPSEPTAAVI